MSNSVETFKQPFLSKVEDSIDKAFSITWDTCHKIYVALDEVSHKYFIDCGYEMVLIKDKAEALNQLHDWWGSSCHLRFIQAVAGESTFHNVISQFDNYEEGEEADWEEEEEDWEEE